MSNPNKIKGDRAERATREVLKTLGFPWCEKTRAGYERDLGDLHLGPGVIAQVKDWGRPDWTLWLRGLRKQIANAGADHGFLVVKRRGVGEPRAGEWLAVMTVEQMAVLLRQAGYGAEIDSEPTRGLGQALSRDRAEKSPASRSGASNDGLGAA